MRSVRIESIAKRLCVAGITAGVFLSQAHAGTVVPGLESFTGSVTPTAVTPAVPPASVVGWSSGENRIWLERVRAVPAISTYSGVPVNLLTSDPDFVAGANYGLTAPNTAFTSVEGVIPTGTWVRSYFFHSYWAKDSTPVATTGSLTFQLPILGVIAVNENTNATRWLAATDGPFGLPQITDYPHANPNRRGLDWVAADYISVSADHKRLVFSLGGDTDAYDEFRIFTGTPEPGAAVLSGTLTAVLLAVAARRRRNRVRS